MARRSLFVALKLVKGFSSNNSSANNFQSLPLVGTVGVSRFLSSGALTTDLVEDVPNSLETDDLKSRIFRIRLPKRSATNVIQRWVSEGNDISITELRQISKELRKVQRYKHALEISEWMVTHEQNELTDSDHATRVDLMTKVFGIDAAERYFEGLPDAVKTSETYTALLHSYAGAKLTDKAEELFERMKMSNLSFDAIAYNEIMTLYMSVGQVEKVSLVVDELKQKKVAPDIFTYNLWISSSAATMRINEVRRILDEMRHDPGCNECWTRYINLANVYVSAGKLNCSDSNALVEEKKMISQREWITYDFLIILYAGLGDKQKIDQIWKSLRMTKQKMTSRNYLCILSSYLMLGNLEDVAEVIDQWKQSTTTDFDAHACKKLLDALTDIGLTELSNNLDVLMIEKNCHPEKYF